MGGQTTDGGPSYAQSASTVTKAMADKTEGNRQTNSRHLRLGIGKNKTGWSGTRSSLFYYLYSQY